MSGKKIRFKPTELSMAAAFAQFITAKKAAGVSKQTVKTYEGQFRAVSRYLDISRNIYDIKEKDIEAAFAALADSELSRNSIRAYSAVLQTFFSWCRREGLSEVEIQLFKGIETVPETYSAEELKKLLKHPNKRRASFAEYRAWAIVNLLVNNGVRSATVRAIRMKDVHLDRSVILMRHSKNGRLMSIPLSSEMVSVLREYIRIRGGEGADFLFCAVDGGELTASGLRAAIGAYNRSRGVKKTSVHAFRHTFARLYLVECGGDALKLQRLLGHTTLEMTKHYVRLFDADLVRDFQEHSPLEAIKKASSQATPGSTRRRPKGGI